MNKKNILPTLLIFYIVLSGIWILRANYQSQKSEKYLNVVQKTAQITQDSLVSEAAFYERIVALDSVFFIGNYVEALSSFENSLVADTFTEPKNRILALRATEIANLIRGRDSTKYAVNIYRRQLTTARTALKLLDEKLDSTDSIYSNQQTISAQSIDSLQLQVSQLTTKLEDKNSIQTISFKNPNNNVVHYLGETKNGEASGKGVGIWSTGGKYEGTWLANKRHGKGTYTWKDGDTYVGYFLNDTREGQGTYHWQTGDKYVGQWKNNKRNGLGVLFNKSGVILFEGNWQDDKILQ